MSRMNEYVNKERGMMFIPFITTGDPNAEATVDLASVLQDFGASALELGIPYSDPLADGPVIQRASRRALENHMTLLKALRLVKRMRESGVKIPVIIFTYVNPLLQLGIETFFHEAKENGVDGLLVPDLPFEESHELSEQCRVHQISLISLVAPTTSDQRLTAICQAAQGFIYCVSSLGVTGVRSHFHPDIFPFLKRVRAASSLPIAVGFGISSRAQVDELRNYADGFIVGSAIVSQIEKRADGLRSENRQAALDEIKHYLQDTLPAAEQVAGRRTV
ncbi:tryptophan synthase subunit alpha [Sporolactobacillus sp. THM19-2]|uniref:tryptophan synthase subunit alpha n=1 Tax=Sporolactobacillus sp. THM19-2 TaxID=2511171 RepID=UPI001020DD4D|nr:tryptophan synthase subunit alpha [Sporolactobacillus sp. THM19-2]RYL93233.1 tryptophan synthase subunit alpha [Sporolactobacillus sp. THM19-2]